jgi:hypothetical protein
MIFKDKEYVKIETSAFDCGGCDLGDYCISFDCGCSVTEVYTLKPTKSALEILLTDLHDFYCQEQHQRTTNAEDYDYYKMAAVFDAPIEKTFKTKLVDALKPLHRHYTLEAMIGVNNYYSREAMHDHVVIAKSTYDALMKIKRDYEI